MKKQETQHSDDASASVRDSASESGYASKTSPRKGVKDKGIGKKSKPKEDDADTALEESITLYLRNREAARKEREKRKASAEVQGDSEALSLFRFLKLKLCLWKKDQYRFFITRCMDLLDETDCIEEEASQVVYQTAEKL